MFRVYADGVSIFDPANSSLTLHSPKVSVEVGKAGSFQFIMPPTNEHYDDIHQMATTIVVRYEGDTRSYEIFRGRVFSVKTDFNKCKEVVCEGSLAYLVDTVQQAKSFKGTCKKLLRKILDLHNVMVSNAYFGSSEDLPNYESQPPEVKRRLFKLGTFEDEEAADTTVIVPGAEVDEDKYYTNKYSQAIIESMANEWVTTYDYINDTILDYVGGYLVARYDENTGMNYLDVVPDTARDGEYTTANYEKPRQVQFAKNLLDISQEFSPEDLCTVVIPIGDTVDKKPLTINKAKDAKSDDTFDIVYDIKGKKIGIKHIAAADKYGLIYKTHNFSNVNDADTLFKDGKKWLKKNCTIPIRFTVKAIDLTFVNDSDGADPIKLGEMISVLSGPHDIDIELLCTKIEYDLENPANNAYTLGNPEQSLTERYRKNKKKQSKSSGGGGGGGGAGAAGAAAGQAQETADGADTKAEEALDKIEKAYIKVDPDNSSITLATWYKDFKTGLQKAGINIDGKNGWVDLEATWKDIAGTKSGLADLKVWADETQSSIEGEAKRINENGEQLAKLTLRVTDNESMFELLAQHNAKTASSLAYVNAKADADHSEINLHTDWQDKVSKDLGSLAEIKMNSDANGAYINQLAQWHDGLSESVAKLNIKASKDETLIEQLATFAGKTAESLASIKTQADANGSYIQLLNSRVDKATNELVGLAETKQWVNEHEAGIRSATEWYSKNGNAALTTLSQLSNDKISQILQAATFYTENSSALASIKAWSTEDAANIRSAAEFVNDRNEDGERKVTSSMSKIEQTANDSVSILSLITNYKVGNKINEASIKLSADALGSAIGIKANEVSLIGDKINLVADKTTVFNALKVDGGNLYVNGGIFAGSKGKKPIVAGSITVSGEGHFGSLFKGDQQTDGSTDYMTRSMVKKLLENYVEKSTYNAHTHKYSFVGVSGTQREANTTKPS